MRPRVALAAIDCDYALGAVDIDWTAFYSRTVWVFVT